MVLALIGLPIQHDMDFLALTVLMVALISGRVRHEIGRWKLAVLLVVLTLLVKFALPRVEIQEGHNLYRYNPSDQLFEQQLPAGMLAELQDAYQRLGITRDVRPVDCVYAHSADAVYQRPAFSRVVHEIDFSDRTTFRLGAENALSVNLYDTAAGFVDWRSKLPYFVRYDLGKPLSGSVFCWKGTTYWQQGEGFARRHYDDLHCERLTVGGRVQTVYGLEASPAAPLAMHLVPGPGLRLGNNLYRFCGAVMSMVLIGLLCQFSDPAKLLIVLLSVATTLSRTYFHEGATAPPAGFEKFILYGTGDDGLTYVSYGRDILFLAIGGSFGEAARGGESVFYFMPGMRYFRAAEMLLFGENTYGLLLFVSLIPALWFTTLRRFVSGWLALTMMLTFLFLPVFRFVGYSQDLYLQLFRQGYGEPLGYGLFVAALILLIDPGLTQLEGRTRRYLLGGLVAAAAVVVRPNLSPSAAILTGCALYRLTQHGLLRPAAALLATFSLLLLVPLHNLLYGGVFVPFTAAAGIRENLKVDGPELLAAFGELFRLEWGLSATRIASHFSKWIGYSYSAALGWDLASLCQFILRPFTLLATVFVACSRRSDYALRTMALSTLAMHGVLLFYVNTGRYAYLAWSLALVVATAWLHGRWRDSSLSLACQAGVITVRKGIVDRIRTGRQV